MESEGAARNFLSLFSEEQIKLFLNILKDTAYTKRQDEQARLESDTHQLVLGFFNPEWSMDKKRNMTKTFLRRIQPNPDDDKKNYESIYVGKDDAKVAIVTFASVEDARLAKNRLSRLHILKMIEFVCPPPLDWKKELALMPPEKRFFASLSIKQMRDMDREIKYQLQFGVLKPRKLRVRPIPKEHQTDTFAARNFAVDSIAFLGYTILHVYVSPGNLDEAQIEFSNFEECAQAQRELLERQLYAEADIL